MRNSFICLFLIFILASCTKHESAPRAYTFNFNGTAVSADLYTAVYHHDLNTGVWSFTGVFNMSSAASNSYVQLNFASQNIILPGTYTYSQTYANNTAGNFSCVNGTLSYSETSGNFQVSEIDSVNHRISGTFQFVAVNTADAANTINVSNGTFTNLNYTVQ